MIKKKEYIKIEKDIKIKNHKNIIKSDLKDKKVKIKLKLKLKKIFRNNLITILSLIMFLSLSNENNFKKLFSFSEIVLTINGTGNQNILSDHAVFGGNNSEKEFDSLPDYIFINGVLQNYRKIMVYNLTRQINIIRMKWNNSLTNCKGMFRNLKNIINIDVSEFDSSQVSDMGCMFEGTSISFLNLNKFNTSSCINMQGMFYNCKLLKVLNLNYFNTSLVTSMKEMFCNCISLIYLDLNNLDASKVENMYCMFCFCNSLKLLNFNISNTAEVTFFNIMFYNVSENIIYCINKETMDLNISSQITTFTNNNCSHSCFINSQNKFIIEEGICIDECSNYANYLYEYNNICYKSCPEGTHNSSYNSLCKEDLICDKYYNYNFTECLEDIPEGYFLNNSELGTIDKCDIKCNNCSLESIKYNLCISCNTAQNYYPKFNDSLNNNSFINCYNESQEGYILENQIYIPFYPTYNNTSDTVFSDENSKNDENNSFIQECNEEELFNGICKIKNNNEENKDYIILNIRNKLIDGSLDSLLLNVTEGGKDIIIQDSNAIYQITSTNNQINNKNENISTILLGECENKLIEHYNISKNESLLIFKVDLYEKGLLIPTIEYEIYNSKTKKQLNLTVCKDIKIDILIPVSIKEGDEYKHNTSSEYYNDICYTYTTENGTDITLNDRKKEFINNNMSLCESNCEYKGYDSNIKKAKCECEPKIKMSLISETINNKDKLLNDLVDIKSVINIINVKIMKCYKVLFTLEGLKENIGNYILLSIIIINIFSVFIFLFKGYKTLYNIINNIIQFKKKNTNKNSKRIKNIKKNINNNNIIKKKYKRKKYKKMKKKNSNYIKTNDDEEINGKSSSKIEISRNNKIKKI